MVAEYERLEVRTMLTSAATAMILANLVRRPGIFGLLSEVSQDGEADVREVRVTNRRMTGKALRELELPGDSLLLLIRRNGERVIPHGTTQLESGDIVTIAGSHGAMTSVTRLLTRQIDRRRE
jgi:Trk K+ transport system NAD-binding subunit